MGVMKNYVYYVGKKRYTQTIHKSPIVGTRENKNRGRGAYRCLQKECGHIFKSSQFRPHCPLCNHGKVLRVRSISNPIPIGLSGKEYDGLMAKYGNTNNSDTGVFV